MADKSPPRTGRDRIKTLAQAALNADVTVDLVGTCTWIGLIIVGPNATLNLKGTVDYFVQNTFNYPTLAEAYRIAGLDAFNRMPIPEEYKVRPRPGKAAE